MTNIRMLTLQIQRIKKKYDKYNKEAGKLWSDSYKEMAIKNIGKDPVTKGYEYIDELPYMHMYD